MAVLAIAAAGAAVGGTIGYGFGAVAIGASIGWAIGAYVGSALFRSTENVENIGPRLEDLSIQTSNYGAPIPDVFGAMKVAGNLIWSSGLIETAHTTEEDVPGGGKGGGGGSSVTNTYYTYSASFAVGLCEGEIGGVGRIWFDSKLYTDFRDGQSQQNRDTVTIYTGSETQTADATIQAYETDADVPGYRGLAYVVFVNVQLANYGNHIPNVMVEVFKNAVGGTYGIIVAPTQNWYVGLSGETLSASSFDQYQIADRGGVYDKAVAFSEKLGLFVVVTSYGGTLDKIYSSPDGVNWTGRLSGTTDAFYDVVWAPSLELFCAVGHQIPNGIVRTSENGITWTSRADAGANRVWRSVCWSEELTLFVAVCSSGTGNRAMSSPDGITWTARSTPTDNDWKGVCWSSTLTLFAAVSSTGTGDRVMTSPDGITWTSRTSASDSSWQGICWSSELNLFCAVGGSAVMTSPDGITWTSRTPAAGFSGFEVIYINDLNEFIAVGIGSTESMSSPDGITWTGYGQARGMYDLYWSGTTQFNYDSSNYPTLGAILTKLCTDCGLTAGDVDVSECTETVYGYVRPNVMPARKAIEPLLFRYLVDAVEVDKKIKFLPRGQASTATIPAADLAAGPDIEPRDNLVEIKANESELPTKIYIKYIRKARKYEIGEQYYEFTFPSIDNNQLIDLPIAMTQTEALQTAQILLTAAWAARTRYNFTTTTEYIYLAPGDVVTVDSIIMRITNMNLAGGLITFEAASEYDADLFDSDLDNDEDDVEDDIPDQPADTITHFIDSSAFNEAGNTAGFYLAAYADDSSWIGCNVYKSTDGGSSFTQIESIVAAATVGYATSVLVGGPVDGLVFDTDNTVTVQIQTPGKTLSSSTEAAVLNGANAALLGVDGRWEIIQYIDVTDNGSNSYTLSNLVRGRRGTEHNMGGHAENDTFILIDSALVRIVLGVSNIGLERIYRFDTLGSLTINDETETFTLSAECLKPYSVTHVDATIDGSDNIIITWIRRDRIDGEWRDNVDIGNSEITESYEIDIIKSGAVLRTLTATSATVTYTAAQQTTDFGYTLSSVRVKIYQISSAVGRGTVKAATVPAAAAQIINATASNITLSSQKATITAVLNVTAHGSITMAGQNATITVV